MKQWKIRFAAAAAILLIVAAVLIVRSVTSDRNQYKITKVSPTCTESGYSTYTDKNTGEVSIRDYVEPLGHNYGAWEILQQPTVMTSGRRTHTCKRCGATEETDCYVDESIPHLNLCGDLTGIGKADSVNLSATLDGDTPFNGYARLKYKGHATLDHPKKNYTLILYEDELNTEKAEIAFKDWNADNKYCLRAHYNDATDCRGLAAADLWAQVVASRAGLQEQFDELSAFGAVPGFSIALYINGEYQGIYSLKVFKDEDLYKIESGSTQACAITNNNTTEEAFFRSTSEFVKYDSAWEIEECGTEDVTWAQDSLNDLLRFVANMDEAAFQAEISDYLDVDAAIDYLVYMYALGISDNLTNNLVLLTYDGKVWIPTAYNLGDAFGLQPDGSEDKTAEKCLPQKTNGVWDSGSGSLLWDRLLNCFETEIRARYAELRQSVLTEKNEIQLLNTYLDAIPTEYHTAENELYPDRPAYTGSEKEMLAAYVKQRLARLDDILLTEGEE